MMHEFTPPITCATMLTKRAFPRVLVILMLVAFPWSVVVRAQDSLVLAPVTGDLKLEAELPNWIRGALLEARAVHGQVHMGIDTTAIAMKIAGLENDLDLQLTQNDPSTIGRNLRVIRDQRTELDRLWKHLNLAVAPLDLELSAYSGYRTQMLQVLADPHLAVVDSDSALSDLFRAEASMVRSVAGNTLERCEANMEAMLAIQERAIQLGVRLTAERDRLSEVIVAEEGSLLTRRYPPLWDLSSDPMPATGEVLVRSWKAFLTTMEAFGAHFWKQLILLRLVVLILAFLPLWYMRRHIRDKEATPYSAQMHFLVKYPAQVGAIFILVLTPLLFTHIPRIAVELFFIGMLTTLATIFVKENAFVRRPLFYAVLVYYVVLKFSNVLLDVTLLKRVWLVLSIALIPLGHGFLKQLLRSGFKHPNRARLLMNVLALQLVIGWVAHLLGWYRLGFFLAISLHIVVSGLYEYLLIFGDRRHRQGLPVPLNLFKAKPRIIRLLDVLALLFWVYGYVNGLDIGELVGERLSDGLAATRTIMGFSFTWWTILSFVAAIALAIFISELLKDLFEEDTVGIAGHRRGGGLLLLLRLFVLFGGFMVALAVSGIPMDRLAIVLGAFSVGIGFGLQNLTNNLVSGIMLAMEKPIRTGDEVAVKDGSGTVMDIGIRSTKLQNTSGSVLIVPNGMLISEMVRNRTLTDRTGEVVVKLQVPLVKDMARVLDTVQATADRFAESGMRAPTALVVELDRRHARLEVHLWVHDVRHAPAKQSQVLREIIIALEGIGLDWNAGVPDGPDED
jgi:potassium efflux system protein